MINKYFNTNSLESLFRRSQFSIFAITFLICTLTFASISVFTVRSFVTQNLVLLSKTVSERVEPALVFKDSITLDAIMDEYTHNYSIRRIEVYNQNNEKIASDSSSFQHYSFIQKLFDDFFFKEPVDVDVYHNGIRVGEVLIYASSHEIISFVIKILLGLLIGMLFMLFALWFSVNAIYRTIMRAILPITQIAQLVSQQKAYNLRFPKNQIQEFNHLNAVFNELLEEIQKWHTRLQSENSQLTHQVQHDDLTKLPNRNYFYQVLCEVFDNPLKRKEAALIFIDNNNFKGINDKYGHLVGDAVLKEMAIRLRQSIRQHDFVARLSGDEFAIIINSVQKVEHLVSIAENLIKCANQPLIYKDQEVYFSFSLGIAIAKEAQTPEDFISQADQAMYKAKTLTHHWSIFRH